MRTIKLKSKKELSFPPFHRGIVELKITKIEIDLFNSRYVLTIEDSCKVDSEEEVQTPIYPENFNFTDLSPENLSKITYENTKVIVSKTLGTPNIRITYKSFENIKQLIQLLQHTNPEIKEYDLDDAIFNAFGVGLYLVTKSEIEDENINWYGSTSIEDWELVIE